jgi:prepilin-type N-terminal cleavage/methylation domain-containing protein
MRIDTLQQRGFSLLEMSFVLIILGVLFSAFLSPFQNYIRHKKGFEACEEIEKIRQALLDFSVVHGRLPWAGQIDGVEMAGKGQGLLPWKTLGLRAQNVWGESYHYRVMPNWADQQPDPVIVSQCNIQQSINQLSVNFCSKGQLHVKRNDGTMLYDKAVVIVTQPRSSAYPLRVCEPGITWLGAETVLGYLVMAGRIY